MRRNTNRWTALALVAALAGLGACSASGTDATGVPGTSRSSGASSSSATPAQESPRSDVLPLPGPDPGAEYATLPGGRYRVPLTDALAVDVDVPDGSASYLDGTFIAINDFILKSEAAGEWYGVPRDPCTDQTIKPVGPAVDDLVTALGHLPIYRMTRPEAVELGGADGIYVEARIPRTYDASACDGDGVVQLPGNPGTAATGPPPYLGRWWVLDVDGQRVVLQQNCWGCTTDQLDRDLPILQGISFTPTP